MYNKKISYHSHVQEYNGIFSIAKTLRIMLVLITKQKEIETSRKLTCLFRYPLAAS